MKYQVERAGKVLEVDVELHGDTCIVRGPDAESHRLRLEPRTDGSQRIITPWGELEVQSVRRGAELWADVSGRRLQARVERARPASAESLGGASLSSIRAPMAGKLLCLHVATGDAVRAGQPLAVIEAMKMENELVSPLAGVVTQVVVQAPSAVDKGTLILTLERR